MSGVSVLNPSENLSGSLGAADRPLHSPENDTTPWWAVWSLFMGVLCLIAAEFVPVSLLSPMATDFGITAGTAGQSVTVVGIFAVIASLCTAPLTRRINRRRVLLSLSAVLVMSNLLIAYAPNYPLMLIGRALLGVCVGGFWSMCSAVALQLAACDQFTRVLSVIYAGVSVATILTLPLASLLGDWWGWRGVFIGMAVLSAISFLWQCFSLPSLPAQSGAGFRAMFGLLKTRWILLGILATFLSYAGYHLFFTYVRPFLESFATLSSNGITGVLLLFGLMNCLGNLLAGRFLHRHLAQCLRYTIAAFIALALALLAGFFFHAPTVLQLLLLLAWGFAFGFICVGWSAWIGQYLADKAELAGGLSVAFIQCAIGLAAGIGGGIFDSMGQVGLWLAALVLMLLAYICTAKMLSLYRKVQI